MAYATDLLNQSAKLVYVRDVRSKNQSARIALMGVSLGGAFAAQAALKIAEEDKQSCPPASGPIDLINVRSFSRISDVVLNMLNIKGRGFFSRLFSLSINGILKLFGGWNLPAADAVKRLHQTHGYRLDITCCQEPTQVSPSSQTHFPVGPNSGKGSNGDDQPVVVVAGYQNDSLLGWSSLVNHLSFSQSRFSQSRVCRTTTSDASDHNTPIPNCLREEGSRSRF